MRETAQETAQDAARGTALPPELAEDLVAVLRSIVRDVRTRDRLVAEAVPAPVMTLLSLLAARDEPARVSDLAGQLGVGVPAASRQVAAAEGLELVVRTPDPEDGRACRIALSDAGAGAVADHRARRVQELLRVLRGWDPEEVALLVALLGRLEAATGARVAELVGRAPADAPADVPAATA